MQKKLKRYCILPIALIIASLKCPATPHIINNTFLPASISGQIVDADNQQPLAHASVIFPDLRISVSANEHGFYQISNIPNGAHTVEVSYVGYKSFIGAVSIHGSTIKNFALKSSVLENLNVTVTGVTASTNLRNAPYHISILNQRQLQQTTGTSLLDAIAREPGVSIVTTGPAIAKPFIRGLGYNRVITINDGIRQEGQQWGDEHGVEVDEYSAKKIELLRGASSLMYGSDAIGGVLNILTNTPIGNNIIKSSLTGCYNSNNKMFGENLSFSGNINGFNWNAYGSFKNAADYHNKYDGTVLNSRFNEKNFGGLLGLNKNWGYAHLLFSNFDQTIGMIEGARNPSGNLVFDEYSNNSNRKPLVPYQTVRHFKMGLDNSFFLKDGSRIIALLAFQSNQRQEFGNVNEPGVPETHFDLKTFNYNIAYHLRAAHNWKTSIGISGMSQQNKNLATEAIIPDYRLTDFGVYAFSTKTFDKTTLSGGLRFDTRSLTNEGEIQNGNILFNALNRHFSNLSGSLGITHQLNETVSIKANVARGFRAPNEAELAVNGVHEGTRRYEIGNTGLKSENSMALDAGIEVNSSHISINLSPFFNHIANYIFYQKLTNALGADSLIDDDIVFKYNQQSANLYGFEANFDVHPHPLDWLHFENSFSYTRGKFVQPVDGSFNLPLIAPLRLLTELRAEFPDRLKSFKNLYVKVEADNNWPQNKFFAGYKTETATKGYTLFNFGAGSDINIGSTKVILVFTINNITNKCYQSHLSRLKYLDENPATGRMGVFNMGRNFNARVIIPLEWHIH